MLFSTAFIACSMLFSPLYIFVVKNHARFPHSSHCLRIQNFLGGKSLSFSSSANSTIPSVRNPRRSRAGLSVPIAAYTPLSPYSAPSAPARPASACMRSLRRSCRINPAMSKSAPLALWLKLKAALKRPRPRARLFRDQPRLPLSLQSPAQRHGGLCAGLWHRQPPEQPLRPR